VMEAVQENARRPAVMGGKLVASVAIYVAPERSFGAGALDDKRVPALPVTARCSRSAPPSASKRVSGALAPLAEKLQSISQDIGTRHRRRRLRAAAGHWQ
jgi:hypothetical protein